MEVCKSENMRESSRRFEIGISSSGIIFTWLDLQPATIRNKWVRRRRGLNK